MTSEKIHFSDIIELEIKQKIVDEFESLNFKLSEFVLLEY